MSTVVIVVIVVVVVLLLIGLALMLVQRARRRRLQQQFGDEYDQTVQSSGSRRDAERELTRRARRHEELDIRPLDPRRQAEYGQNWMRTQEQFVDDPANSVKRADRLVTLVMQERGYPTDTFEQQVSDVSVQHGSVTSNYRAAHEIAQLNDRGSATTEQLREAMLHYRVLFDELLREGSDVSNER
jgi:hypothetical protein